MSSNQHTGKGKTLPDRTERDTRDGSHSKHFDTERDDDNGDDSTEGIVVKQDDTGEGGNGKEDGSWETSVEREEKGEEQEEEEEALDILMCNTFCSTLRIHPGDGIYFDHVVSCAIDCGVCDPWLTDADRKPLHRLRDGLRASSPILDVTALSHFSSLCPDTSVKEERGAGAALGGEKSAAGVARQQVQTVGGYLLVSYGCDHILTQLEEDIRFLSGHAEAKWLVKVISSVLKPSPHVPNPLPKEEITNANFDRRVAILLSAQRPLSAAKHASKHDCPELAAKIGDLIRQVQLLSANCSCVRGHMV